MSKRLASLGSPLSRSLLHTGEGFQIFGAAASPLTLLATRPRNSCAPPLRSTRTQQPRRSRIPLMWAAGGARQTWSIGQGPRGVDGMRHGESAIAGPVYRAPRKAVRYTTFRPTQGWTCNSAPLSASGSRRRFLVTRRPPRAVEERRQDDAGHATRIARDASAFALNLIPPKSAVPGQNSSRPCTARAPRRRDASPSNLGGCRERRFGRLAWN